MRLAALIAVGWLAAAGPALADPHQVRAGHIIVSSRVVRASIGHSPNTAAYATIANTGDQPDQLVSVSCACAAKVEIHATEMAHGMMTMGAVAPVTIPAHGSIAFRPGGLHLMLTGLKETLVDGGDQMLTLTFRRQGPVKATFHIRSQIGVGEAPMAGVGH